MKYTPVPDSLAARVLKWLRANPTEELSARDISIKFGCGTSGVHTQLQGLLANGLAVRTQDSDGAWVYRVGDDVQAKDMALHKRKPKGSRPVDPADLSICDDPIPKMRALPLGKYRPIFERLEPGRCIKCPSEQVTNIANAMHKWIHADPDRARRYVAKSIRRYDDGAGRVWLLEREPAGKALKAVA